MRNISIQYDEIFSEEHNGFLGAATDTQGRKMPFLVRPAKSPEMSRALVVLHGHGANKTFAKFHDENWTTIMPLDIHGYDGLGSWWLGERDDLFVYDLLQAIIMYLRNHYTIPALYFWGSSMGGYGAIVHGLALQAHAIYAHMPQTRLSGTKYTDGANRKYYEGILSASTYPQYDNLSLLIRAAKVKKSPVLFLSQNTIDYPGYIQEHFLPLVSACDKKGLRFSAIMSLAKGHVLYHNIAQSIELYFDKEYKSIKEWRLS